MRNMPYAQKGHKENRTRLPRDPTCQGIDPESPSRSVASLLLRCNSFAEMPAEMPASFFDRPILNSPYDYPARHWELDESGQPTNGVIERRRPAKQAELDLADALGLSTAHYPEQVPAEKSIALGELGE